MSIENEIASLTQSTTGLLTAVNTKKAILDTAVTNAEAAATNSTAQAVTSTSAKNSSEAARDAAVVAKNAANTSALNAASVVTGGTATVAPQAGKIPLADSEGKIDVDWLSSASTAMSKADFFALAEKRKADSAGSGFAEWGKAHNSGYDYINEGMYTRRQVNVHSTLSKALHLGRIDGSVGISRTDGAMANINGTLQSILPTSASSLYVNFPDAPDGTKTYDSATGSVVTHASPAEAFEGDTTNGDFRNGSTGWNLSSEVAVTGGKLVYTNITGTRNINSSNLPVTSDSSTLYTVQVYVVVNAGELRVQFGGGGGASNATTQIFETGLYTVTSSFDQGILYLQGITGFDGEVHSVSLLPVTESVVTSRQDLVFLESFHEKISDKDVVYPLGNVQYGATSWESISLSTSVVAQGYSAFGEWDTSTTGRGVVWSTLSEANKAKFIKDPENNIYLEDGELIQVRYRVRVIEGLGDEWLNVDTQSSASYAVLYTGQGYVKPKGKLTNLTADLAGYNLNESGAYFGKAEPDIGIISHGNYQEGTLYAGNKSASREFH